MEAQTEEMKMDGLIVSIILNQIVEFQGSGGILLILGFILRVRTDIGLRREGVTPGIDDLLGDGGVEGV